MSTSSTPLRASAPPAPWPLPPVPLPGAVARSVPAAPVGPAVRQAPAGPAIRQWRRIPRSVAGRYPVDLADRVAGRSGPVLDESGPLARLLRAVVVPGLVAGGALIWLVGALLLVVSVDARHQPETTASLLALALSLLCLCLATLLLVCLLACHLLLRRRDRAVTAALVGGGALGGQLATVVLLLTVFG